MNNDDATLTSPIFNRMQSAPALLCLTIVWHPDLARVGEQAILTGANGATQELARFQPLFGKPEQDGLPLGHGGVSREATRLVRDGYNGVLLTPPHSRMVVEVNGVEIQGAHYLSSEQISAGVILGLGRTILLCLHWLHALPKHNPVEGLIGVGSSAQKTRDLIRQVAATDAAVLLLGETGTGKEVAARAIHALSQRNKKSLVSVNMAAMNDALAAADLFGAAKGAYTGASANRGGLFQEAEGATLFLDEIGNAPATVQPMLLRVLETGDYRPLGASQDRTSSARIIAATDQNLYDGGFNPALLRRLESFIIHIPPLRARREDIGLLLVHLMQTPALAGLINPLTPALPAALVSQFANYDWPGNIRQLRHLLKRVLLGMAMGDVPSFESLIDTPPQRITDSAASTEVMASPASCDPAAAAELAPASLPPLPLPATPLAPTPHAIASAQDKPPVRRQRPADLSEDDILNALNQHGWMIQAAASELGISRPSMYKLLEMHSQIRQAEQIAPDEIQAALAQVNGNVPACAAHLKTPVEALRRRLALIRGNHAAN